jgi:hypothetical protein
MTSGAALQVTAQQLASAFGDACVMLGIRADGGAVIEQVFQALREPVDRFNQYINWPCPLNNSGLPFEMSLKLDGPGSASLRCVVDGTDHRLDAEGNWQTYLRRSIAVAGAQSPTEIDSVRTLCRRHLAGMPAQLPSRLVHGLGYAAPNQIRGSLYFQTGWLNPPELAARIPDYGSLADTLVGHYSCQLPGRVEVIGYDFALGQVRRSKAYTWLPVPSHPASFSKLAGTNPELAAAGELFERYAARVSTRTRDHAAFLQSGWDGGQIRQRVFFFAAAWGWDKPQAIRELLMRLAIKYGLDLNPLMQLRQVLGGHSVRMRLSMVAVGGGRALPSVTFYFLPAASEGSGEGQVADRPKVMKLYESGADHLLAERRPEGDWSGGGRATSMNHADRADTSISADDGELITAWVAATLAQDPNLRSWLDITANWLRERYGMDVAPTPTGLAGASIESNAMAALALVRLDRPVPKNWETNPASQCTGDVEVLATVLLAMTERASPPYEDALAGLLAADLLDLQRENGGWEGSRWASDLLATTLALRALFSFQRSAPNRQDSSVARALELGAAYVHDALIDDDAFQLALWLSAWLASGRRRIATIDRIVQALAEQQQPDGRWVSPGVHDALTTATVLDALRALQAATTLGQERF